MRSRTVAIAGPGAMGILLACHLRRAGVDVLLLDHREERAAELSSAGIWVEGLDGGELHASVRVTTDLSVLAECCWLILLMKAWQAERAFPEMARHISPAARVLCLQNGMGHHRYMAAALPEHQILIGTTAHGSTLLDTGRVRHAGKGITIVGQIRPEAPGERLMELQAMLTAAGWECRVVVDIWPHCWRKLVVNCAINPLTALTGLSNGELLEHPETTWIMERVVAEVCEVARAEGIDMEPKGMFETVKEVCRATAGNRSSMLQDVLADRPTEIDYISGAVQKTGMEHHIPTPFNTGLYNLVKKLSSSGNRPAFLPPSLLKQRLLCGI